MSSLDDVREGLEKIKENRPEAQPTPWPSKSPPQSELEDEDSKPGPKPNLPQGQAGY